MRPSTILTIEDDSKIIDILRLYLEREGFTVYTALNAIDGLRLMQKVKPDIVLLDIKLPDSNGFELARKYRMVSDGILIFITGEKTQSTIMKGFEIGCDDYITKPFDPPEVIARIKANLRRTRTVVAEQIVIESLTINLSDKNVYKHGESVELFAKEKLLLFHLAQHPNQVLSTEQLFDLIWGMDSSADIKTVQVHISTLRRKIEDDPKNPQFIQTVRGFGYRLVTK
ncbi:response regulator transcription factor [Bacillus rubiinfantis]|uniref:response regulator transcription factor n=1 Tax=Bacillus rubiinfantis TaxID=1499680 RepID=UPI0005AB126F|nr:response regulator transcription factor [Bacillus rubiinfantis]